MSSCPICDAEMRPAFTATLLQKHLVDYRRCPDCGFLQTEAPHWLDEAYGDAIAVADTGLVMRNLTLASRLATLLYLQFDPRAAYLDVAGGYGMLARLMRDFGFDYYWEDKYCSNLLARGFEAEKAERPFAALSAFEVLEHVHEPLSFVKDLMERHGSRTLIFSTELYEGKEAPPADWWYYAFNTGQHISFFQHTTLRRLAERLNLNFYTLRGIHILTDRTLDIGPVLKLLTGVAAPIAAVVIRRRLGSLTLKDHNALIGAVNFNRKGN